MKRVRCPKCDQYVIFDDTKYQSGQSLVFACTACGKKFGIRLGVSKIHNTQKEDNPDEILESAKYGSIIVIENVFQYKQVFPLKMGNNVIGKYMKGDVVDCAIETVDPSIDPHHCCIQVSRDKKGRLRYTLSDGPSNTGTFVDNEILGDRERRVIDDGTVFSIGASSVILRGEESKTME